MDKFIENNKNIYYLDPNNGKLLKFSKSSNNIKELINKLNNNQYINKPHTNDSIGIFLMVAQNCNMRCKYCYADHGKYNKREGLLSKEKAIDIVNFLIKNFRLEYIQFFGGEPSLNLNIIDYIIDYIKSLKKRGIINYIPFFSMVTNLYSNIDKLSDIVKKHNIELTVSIDGDNYLHNTLRKDKFNCNTFNTIKNNYDKLLYYDITPSIEVTYTGLHQNYMDLDELYEYFIGNFKFKKIFITSVVNCGIEENLRLDFKEFYQEKKIMMLKLMDRMCTNDPIYSSEIINNIKKILTNYNRNFYLCRNAPGSQQFTIDIDGDFYPCYCMSGSNDLQLGNIKTIRKNDIMKSKEKYDNLNKNNRACYGCRVKGLCSVCLANDYYSDDKLKFGEINSNNCKFRKDYYTSLLLKYIDIIEDKSLSDKFIKNMIKGLNL